MIQIDNMELPIGGNLNAALVMLRQTDSAQIIWVDAICINQDSDEVGERNH